MKTLLKLILRKLSVIISLMRVIAIVCLCFCTWMCIHYLIQHYPNANITSQPFDYNGMLTSFFTLLVTLLVGWNIYSTINAKEELEKTTNKLNELYGKDIAKMKADIQELKDKNVERAIMYAEQRHIEDVPEVDTRFVDLHIPQETLDRVDRDIMIRGTKLFMWACNIVDEYKSFKQIFETYKVEKKKHPKSVTYLNGQVATDEEAAEIIKYVRNEKLAMFAKIRAMREQTDIKNGDV